VSRANRTRRRFHTDRIIAKRAKEAKRVAFWKDADWEPVRGRLDNEQWYLGCHSPRCGICHPQKRWNYGERGRLARRWRDAEGL
jgi:hypothetical protein